MAGQAASGRDACHSPCPGKPKVADSEVTGGIDEEIAWLQVSMQDVCSVHVLEALQDLHGMGSKLNLGSNASRKSQKPPSQVSAHLTIMFGESAPDIRRTGSGHLSTAAAI